MPRKKYRSIRRPKRVCPYYRRAVSGSSTPSVTTVTSSTSTITTAASVVTASQKKLSKSAFIDDEAKELCKCVDSIESLESSDSNENTGSSCESSGCESSSSDGSSGEESDECCSVVRKMTVMSVD